MKKILFTTSLLTYVISLCLINIGYNTDYIFSVLYVILAIQTIALSYKVAGSTLNLFVLFMFTFHLFIGGRFFLYVFNNTLDPFEPTFFYNYYVSRQHAVSLMNYVYSFVYFITLGYSFSSMLPIKCPYKVTGDFVNANIVECISKKCFPILSIILIYNAVKSMIDALANGYIRVDDAVSNSDYSVSFVIKFASMLLVLLIALNHIYAKHMNKRYIKLYLIYGIAVLVSGSRAAFGSVILLLVLMYSDEHKIKLWKIGLSVTCALAFLLVVFSVSARGAGLEAFTFSDAFKVFLHNNGISLMVFDVTRQVDGYPIIGYFQTFIPGATFIYSLLTPLPSNEATFSSYMCYNINPKFYDNGWGLGWTSLSDLYVFSNSNIIAFCLLAYLLGVFFFSIEYWSKKNVFYKYLILCIAPGVFMMARGYLSALFVQIYYAIAFYYIIYLYSKYKLSKRKTGAC